MCKERKSTQSSGIRMFNALEFSYFQNKKSNRRMKYVKGESILPTSFATPPPSCSKDESLSSMIWAYISLLFLSLIGLFLVHQHIQVVREATNLREVVRKVVNTLDIMDDRIAEVEADINIVIDGIEEEVYDTSSESTSHVENRILSGDVNTEDSGKSPRPWWRRSGSNKFIPVHVTSLAPDTTYPAPASSSYRARKASYPAPRSIYGVKNTTYRAPHPHTSYRARNVNAPAPDPDRVLGNLWVAEYASKSQNGRVYSKFNQTKSDDDDWKDW